MFAVLVNSASPYTITSVFMVPEGLTISISSESIQKIGTKLSPWFKHLINLYLTYVRAGTCCNAVNLPVIYFRKTSYQYDNWLMIAPWIYHSLGYNDICE